jgi:hypothetical protein
MRRTKFFTPILLLLACAAATAQAADPSSTPIGPAGDVSKLVIHGLDDTLAAQLRTALAERLSLIRIEEPSTPENIFLQTIGDAAKQALLADGFPRAAVAPSRDKDLAVLDITPGPRYREGDVIIDAPPGVDASALRNAFTAPIAPSNIHIQQTGDSIVLTLNGFSDLLKETATADWIPGKPVAYDEQSLDDIADTFRSAMRDQGYTDWDAATNYAPDDVRHVTSLKIAIKSVGPKPRLAVLTIHGNTTNSDAVIREFLHITADTTVDLPTVRQWFEALVASGRFTSQKLTLQTPAASAQVALDLTELPGVPPLNQPLSPVDQALLASMIGPASWPRAARNSSSAAISSQAPSRVSSMPSAESPPISSCPPSPSPKTSPCTFPFLPTRVRAAWPSTTSSTSSVPKTSSTAASISHSSCSRIISKSAAASTPFGPASLVPSWSSTPSCSLPDSSS